MQLKGKKLKGSSLIEVVVSMVIISIAVTLSFSFFSQILESSGRMAKMKAWYVLNSLKNETIITENVNSEEFVFHSFKILKESELVNKEKDLWLINLQAISVLVDSSGFNQPENDPLYFERFYLECKTDKRK